MRFYTIIINGQETPAVSVDGGQTAFLLDSLGYSYEDMNQLICRTTPEELEIMKKAAARAVPEKSIDLRAARFCAPIVTPRQDVICLGINYDEHAKEAGMYSKEAFGGERPYTIYFSKRVSRANGSGETVPSYAGLVDSLDYEAELGVVLGQDVKDISESEALSAVFGYTIINDVSARNLQTRHKQWYKGKSLDGFTPMGPCDTGRAGDLRRPRKPADFLHSQRTDPAGQQYLLYDPDGGRRHLRTVAGHDPAERYHHCHRHPGRCGHGHETAAVPAARR